MVWRPTESLLLGDHVYRTVLGLYIRLRQIFAKHAEGEQLQSAHEQYDADHAGPSRNRISEHHRPDHDEHDSRERQEAEQQPNDRREDKRDYGEADDTLNRVFEQREEIPFAFSLGTFDVLI